MESEKSGTERRFKFSEKKYSADTSFLRYPPLFVFLGQTNPQIAVDGSEKGRPLEIFSLGDVFSLLFRFISS